MLGNYILGDDGVPVECRDILEWADWVSTHDRTLAKTKVGYKTVSTVFLSIDHRFGPGDPILWETIIFNHDGSASIYQERYSSQEDALKGHTKAVNSLLHRFNRYDEHDQAEIIPFDKDFKH